MCALSEASRLSPTQSEGVQVEVNGLSVPEAHEKWAAAFTRAFSEALEPFVQSDIECPLLPPASKRT